MPIVVLHGPEQYIKSELTTGLREDLRDLKGDVEVYAFDGERDELADVLDECRSFGLMQTHKLVIVDQADQLVKDTGRGPVERYAQSPSDMATLVLRCSTWHKGNLDKLIDAAGGTVYKCDVPSERDAISWAGRRAKNKHGASISVDAARLLVNRLGPDLGRIDSELGKLAVAAGAGAVSGAVSGAVLGVGGDGTITPELVAEFVGATREEEVWSIQQPLLTGDPERAIGHLRAILDHGPRDAAIPVMFACVDLAKKLHLASHALASGMPAQGVGRHVGIWGPAQSAILGASSRISPARASALFREAIETDQRSKSGLGDAKRLVERLALKLCLAVRSRG